MPSPAAARRRRSTTSTTLPRRRRSSPAWSATSGSCSTAGCRRCAEGRDPDAETALHREARWPVGVGALDFGGTPDGERGSTSAISRPGSMFSMTARLSVRARTFTSRASKPLPVRTYTTGATAGLENCLTGHVERVIQGRAADGDLRGDTWTHPLVES